MTLNSYVVSAFALAAFLLTGCDRSTFDPTLAGVFFPLRAGSTWTYRVIDDTYHTTEVYTDHAVAVERTAAPGAAAGEIVTEYTGPSGRGKSTILYATENGYINRMQAFGPDQWRPLNERGFLPELLWPGLTWSNTMFPLDSEPDSFRVTQTHRTFVETAVVKVPAGSYTRCIRIETDAVYSDDSPAKRQPRRVRYVDWYAPYVGLVKTAVSEPGFLGAEIARVELVTFSPSRIKTASQLSGGD